MDGEDKDTGGGDGGENPFEGFVTHDDSPSTEEGNEGDTSDDDGAKKGEDGDDGGDSDNDDDDATGSDDGEGEGDDADDDGEGEGDEGSDDDDDDADDDDADDDQAELDLDDPGKKKKGKKTVRQRIDELTKKRRSAERDRDATENAAVTREKGLIARIDALEKKLTDGGGDGTGKGDKSSDGPQRPKPEDFTYGEVDAEYTEALADYRIDLRLAKEKDTAAEADQQKVIDEKQVVFDGQYQDKVEDGITAYDDFEDVVVNRADKGEFPLSAETVIMVLESPVGHHVVYKIASTKGLAEKLAQMSPLQQAKEFGRLEAQFDDKTPPKNKKHTKAKPPPKKRAGGKSPKQIDASTKNFADFEQKVEAQQRRQKRK